MESLRVCSTGGHTATQPTTEINIPDVSRPGPSLAEDDSPYRTATAATVGMDQQPSFAQYQDWPPRSTTTAPVGTSQQPSYTQSQDVPFRPTASQQPSLAQLLVTKRLGLNRQPSIRQRQDSPFYMAAAATVGLNQPPIEQHIGFNELSSGTPHASAATRTPVLGTPWAPVLGTRPATQGRPSRIPTPVATPATTAIPMDIHLERIAASENLFIVVRYYAATLLLCCFQSLRVIDAQRSSIVSISNGVITGRAWDREHPTSRAPKPFTWLASTQGILGTAWTLPIEEAWGAQSPSNLRNIDGPAAARWDSLDEFGLNPGALHPLLLAIALNAGVPATSLISHLTTATTATVSPTPDPRVASRTTGSMLEWRNPT
ncbi:hypothetical protein T492DRAFT_867170 [Pavlovales sp. CCMP2436]|nr:hypothetical protein T492DRAFT_867170 [Pavlovales sp. CCMP2436]